MRGHPGPRFVEARFVEARFIEVSAYFASLAGMRQKGHGCAREAGRVIPVPPIRSCTYGAVVIHSLLFRHAAVIGAAVTLSLSSALCVLPAHAAQTPSQQDPLRDNAAGNYLAARHAGIERDAGAAASYYLNVLKADPKNADLLSRTFLSVLTTGDIDQASKLADKLLAIDKNDRIARLVLGVRALKARQYTLARQDFSQSVHGPVTDLAAALLTAWSRSGAGDPHAAVDEMDKLAGPDWYGVFRDLHAGLIFDLAGDKKDAAKRYESAYKADPTALRTVQAYGRYLSRNGGKTAALKIYDDFNKQLPDHPLVTAEVKEITAGDKLPPLVDSAQAGAAEALYGIGASIGRRGGEDLALIYLQLALYLQPSHGMALLSLADLYETLKKPDLAIKIYDRIPASSPLHQSAEIQSALDLDALDNSDEAKKRLERVIADHPKDTEALMALGNIERERKDFTACGATYSKALDAIPTPTKSNWVMFYFRGICYERSDQWPKAEADMQKALALFPDQPLVLNYLGYSWVDKGMHLDQGMDMIRHAVEQRPDDGYIVDSLGWAYFRTGNYDEAVKELERAVLLKPDDPTINDHLGDAYWRVGRTLEAHFQWSQAKDFKPEPDELVTLEKKLKDGLPADTSPSADVTKAKKAGNGG
jgi:tetratricopeptide (TPR) repeat protein